MWTVEAPNKKEIIKLASSLAEYPPPNVVSTGSILAEDSILVLRVLYQRMEKRSSKAAIGGRAARCFAY